MTAAVTDDKITFTLLNRFNPLSRDISIPPQQYKKLNPNYYSTTVRPIHNFEPNEVLVSLDSSYMGDREYIFQRVKLLLKRHNITLSTDMTV